MSEHNFEAYAWPSGALQCWERILKRCETTGYDISFVYEATECIYPRLQKRCFLRIVVLPARGENRITEALLHK